MNNNVEKIRNGWHECDNLVWNCQKHGFFYCKVLVSPAEKHCQSCLSQKESQLKTEEWIKAKEKAQNWWKSLSLLEKQEQIKLLESNFENKFKQEKNINKNEKLISVEWGNIYNGQKETYRNGKFSTTNIELVPNKLVEKFMGNSSSEQTQPNNNQFPNSNQQPNQSVLNQPSLSNQSNYFSNSPQTENFSFDSANTGFLEAPNNQNDNRQEAKKPENRGFSPSEPKNLNSCANSNDTHSQGDISEHSSSDRQLQKSPISIPLSVLLVCFAASIITFILWKKR